MSLNFSVNTRRSFELTFSCGGRSTLSLRQAVGLRRRRRRAERRCRRNQRAALETQPKEEFIRKNPEGLEERNHTWNHFYRRVWSLF